MQIPRRLLIELLLPLWHRNTKKEEERCYTPHEWSRRIWVLRRSILAVAALLILIIITSKVLIICHIVLIILIMSSLSRRWRWWWGRRRRSLRVISLGSSSIALFPFWRFDAKGGEVVLLGLRVRFARVQAQAYAFAILFWACVHLCQTYSCFAFMWNLCEPLCLSCETYGISYMVKTCIIVLWLISTLLCTRYSPLSKLNLFLICLSWNFLSSFLTIWRCPLPICVAFVFQCNLIICTHSGWASHVLSSGI